MNKIGNYSAFLLGVIASGECAFVDFSAHYQENIDELINAGLVEIIHGARRVDDRLVATDAGRAYLEAQS